MVRRLRKGGAWVAKCETCGSKKRLKNVEAVVPLLKVAERTKEDYENALRSALTAKYDVFFNYVASSEDQNSKVAALSSECLKKKKAYESAADEYARAIENPDIPLEKLLTKNAKTEVAYKTQNEIRQRIWDAKFKVPKSGARPPLERVWWFEPGNI
jgi:hypothetical protein